MARSPRDKLDRERQRVIDSLDDATASAVLDFADAFDKAGKAPRTTEHYCRCLRIFADSGVQLLDGHTAPGAINELMDEWYDDGRGLSTNTLIGYQSAARAFYAHLDGAVGVEPEEIDTYTPDKTPRHDEGDVFTEGEVFALRDACGRTRNPTRNRAFLELLLFTGQRIHALLTLRVSDVDLPGGAVYLNTKADGLKGALRRGRRRPLFGARKYVREWVQAHPTGEWLFVGDPSHPDTDIDDHWDYTSAWDQLRRLAELARVEKPVNAHNFRHYTVTVLRRDYEQDWEDIGALLGLVKGSSVAKTTYAHVDDDKSRRALEENLGYAQPEPSNRFAPPVCPTCAEVMKPNWRSCPSCNERFGPGGRSLGDLLDERTIDADNADERLILQAARRILDGNHDDSSAA